MTGEAVTGDPPTASPLASRLADVVARGSSIVVSHSAAEPVPLVEALAAEAGDLAPAVTFVGLGLSETLGLEAGRALRLTALGGAGTTRRFFRDRSLAVIPAHYSNVPRLMRDGLIPVDVALLQVAPQAGGAFNIGVMADYLAAAASVAGRVVAEVNDRMPRTFGDTDVPADKVVALVHTSRPLLEQKPARIGDVERAIGEHVARLVPDGATVQVGLGAIADAVLSALGGKRDLGIHTGVIGDKVIDLVEAGVVTGRRKERDEGKVVTGSLLGTERLYRWADRNEGLVLRGCDYTHASATLAAFETLVTINSAIEVDLTGQTNAEVVGTEHVGLIGGHADFVRAGAISTNGRSVIALPATAMRGSRSRIVTRLEAGVVTTSRADVDTVVTEYGVAELKGRTLEQRAEALIAIAHPDFRQDLRGALDGLV